MIHDAPGLSPEQASRADAPAWSERIALGLEHLLHAAHIASPDELPELVGRASALFGADESVLYLADLQQRVLVPFRPAPAPSPGTGELGIDSTVAGRAFQTMQRLTQAVEVGSDDDRAQVWVPLLDGAERVGVLGLVLPAPVLEDPPGMERLHRFASALAGLLVTKALYGDSVVRARRARPMSLAAEVQWSLLPPLTFVNSAVTVTGGLEPAYEVAGDSLDYAVDGAVARFAVFDGMGHGIISAQMVSLVVAAYRNARRAGMSLLATAAHVESAVTEVFRVESFATGLLCELDTDRGMVRWVNAGHHPPLLLREGRLVRPLEVEPMLPLGLNMSLAAGRAVPVGAEQLEPGDMLLLYTDGVTEARSPSGDFFGQDRLVDVVGRHLAAGLPTPEAMRRTVHELLEHQSGDLDDDATLLLVEWHGPAGPEGVAQSRRLSLTGTRVAQPSWGSTAAPG